MVKWNLLGHNLVDTLKDLQSECIECLCKHKSIGEKKEGKEKISEFSGLSLAVFWPSSRAFPRAGFELLCMVSIGDFSSLMYLLLSLRTKW